MNPTLEKLWIKFVRGESLGPLSQANMRGLLDLARSELLSKGRSGRVATAPTGIITQTAGKKMLADARKELQIATIPQDRKPLPAASTAAATKARAISHKPSARRDADPRFSTPAPAAKKRGATYKKTVIARANPIRSSISATSHK